MPNALAEMLRPDSWPTFVFLTARLGGMMFIAPLWSMTSLPRFARAAITVVLAALLLPLAPRVAGLDHVLEMPIPLATEMVIGIAIGLGAAIVVQGVALAGEIVSTQMGLSLGPVLAPTPDVQVSGVGQLQTMLALLVYTGMGGHLMLLRGLADSLKVLPPGAPVDLADGGRAVTSMFGVLFTCALRAGAPVILALLVSNVALAILGRAVPQLNVMMVSFPITIGVGLIMLGASLPLLTGAIAGWMEHLPVSTAAAIDSFVPIP